MSRSGFNRGLAVSAVSALAITGAPFFASPAFAANYDVDEVLVTAEDQDVQEGTGTTDITVQVLDENDDPIAGVPVYHDDDNNGVGNGAPVLTDNNGRAVFTGEGAGTHTFLVDADHDGPTYEDGTDFRRSITITDYEPTVTAPLTVESKNGTAFDFDENDDNGDDLRIRVTDQQGDGVAGETVRYNFVITPFNGGATTTTPEQTGVSDADGYVNVLVPELVEGTYVLNYYINSNGTPGQQAGDVSGDDFTFKMGDAEIVFDKASPQAAPIGGSATVSGTLQLDDGTGLAGRPILLTAAGDNAKFDQSSGADQSTREVVTDAEGNFSAVLDDPNSDLGTENSTVTAETTDNEMDDDVDHANESSTQQVRFQRIVPADEVIITNTTTEKSAGELQTIKVCVEDANNQPLTNQEVALTTDAGYFTDGQEPAAGVGNYTEGVYDNDGQSKTYTTGGDGCVNVTLSIGRDEDFDDDGEVVATVTATSGGKSDTTEVLWTSEDPLNAGELDLVFAEEQESELIEGDDGPATARTGQEVGIEVIAYDQFGNRVGDEDVVVDSDGVGDIDDTFVQTDYDDDAEVFAFSDSAGEQTVTGTWTYDSTKFTADNTNAPADGDTAPDETTTDEQTDSLDITWYEAEVSNTTSTMDDDTGGAADIGETVTMTVTVEDQFGQPVEGYVVEFVRSGPGEQDGDVNYNTETNAEGIATYNFTGTEAGTANITAVVRDGSTPSGGSQVATLQDTVVFGDGNNLPDPDGDGQGDITAKLMGKKYNGAAPDRMKVVADRQADGARVKLFIVRDGVRTLIDRSRLNDNGVARFVVEDRNGKRFTRYQARVIETSDTEGALTNKKQLQ